MSMPIKSSSSFPMSDGMGSGAVLALEALPNIINSIGAIVESCNNKAIRIHEITKYAELENNRINKDYQYKCNELEFRSKLMHDAFESDKISGEQIVELAKECLR